MTQTILDGLVLYVPNIQIWTGTVAVSRLEDLQQVNALLPPPEIYSDGRKRLVLEKALNPLYANRKAVDRLFRKPGVRVFGGYGVPVSKCVEVEQALVEHERKHREELDHLCFKLQSHYDELESLHPTFRGFLNRSRLGEDQVRARCKFEIYTFCAASPNPDQSHVAAARFHQISNAIVPELLKKMAEQAGRIYEDRVKGRSTVSRTVTKTIRVMIAKLDTFRMVNPAVTSMVQALNAQMSMVPLNKTLDDTSTSIIAAVLHTMSDPELMMEHGTLACTQQPVQSVQPDIFDEPIMMEPEILSVPKSDPPNKSSRISIGF